MKQSMYDEMVIPLMEKYHLYSPGELIRVAVAEYYKRSFKEYVEIKKQQLANSKLDANVDPVEAALKRSKIKEAVADAKKQERLEKQKQYAIETLKAEISVEGDHEYATYATWSDAPGQKVERFLQKVPVAYIDFTEHKTLYRLMNGKTGDEAKKRIEELQAKNN